MEVSLLTVKFIPATDFECCFQINISQTAILMDTSFAGKHCWAHNFVKLRCHMAFIYKSCSTEDQRKYRFHSQLQQNFTRHWITTRLSWIKNCYVNSLNLSLAFDTSHTLHYHSTTKLLLNTSDLTAMLWGPVTVSWDTEWIKLAKLTWHFEWNLESLSSCQW